MSDHFTTNKEENPEWSLSYLPTKDPFNLGRYIRTIPDFPKEGILYRDITTLLSHPQGWVQSINALSKLVENKEIDYIAAPEARGLILGSALAILRGIPLIPIRKKGKLPYKTFSKNYELEYGTDTLEIHQDVIRPGDKILLVDDLMATGGTALCCLDLVNEAGGKTEDFICLIDLPELNGSQKISEKGIKFQSLMDYPGH